MSALSPTQTVLVIAVVFGAGAALLASSAEIALRAIRANREERQLVRDQIGDLFTSAFLRFFAAAALICFGLGVVQ